MFTTCINFTLFESDLKIELQTNVSCFWKDSTTFMLNLPLSFINPCLPLVGVKVDFEITFIGFGSGMTESHFFTDSDSESKFKTDSNR